MYSIWASLLLHSNVIDLRLSRNSVGWLRWCSLSLISSYASSFNIDSRLNGNSNNVSPLFLFGWSDLIKVGTIRSLISNLKLSSYIRGVEVYWNTALNPTPNFPIVASLSFDELPTDVIALISPKLLFALSISSFCGSLMLKCRVPLWIKINLSISRMNFTQVALASSAFCNNS